MASNNYGKGKYGSARLGPARAFLTDKDRRNIQVEVRVDPEPIQVMVDPFVERVHKLTVMPYAEPIQVDVRIPLEERVEE